MQQIACTSALIIKQHCSLRWWFFWDDNTWIIPHSMFCLYVCVCVCSHTRSCVCTCVQSVYSPDMPVLCWAGRQTEWELPNPNCTSSPEGTTAAMNREKHYEEWDFSWETTMNVLTQQLPLYNIDLLHVSLQHLPLWDSRRGMLPLDARDKQILFSSDSPLLFLQSSMLFNHDCLPVVQ